ncbi:MAG TPA: feruloyl-CoA synthase [Polyangiaceae bacterium]|nr:feruloyl-CoA synthase [Polyangiaceae bacterium]
MRLCRRRERSVPAKMFAPAALEIDRRAGGTLLVRSRQSLGAYERCIGEYLLRWAKLAPLRSFLMERGPDGGWRGVTYAEALTEVRRLGASLLRAGLSADRPVMVLSGNSVEHGLLTLACLHVGIPIAPISPAYSLVSRDFVKLTSIVETLRPGLIYVADPQAFAPALSALRGRHDATIVVSADAPRHDGATPFDSWAATGDVRAADEAFARVSPDTIAKFLFTSGSTDEPKAVINTQRMLCSNQYAIRQLWPFLEEPPVLVDWLPWHHTFGGNHNFNLTVCNGGTLYIDGGRPVVGEFERSLENLRDVAPTVVFNVPRAYDLLATALRADRDLREKFFGRLRLIFYAAASLPQSVWDSLRSLAEETLGREVPMVSSWGLTETAPAATSCHFQAERAGVIGLPVPGCELKLVESGDKLEARVRGPNVTPGYWRRADLTAACFDEEGFFKTGDAVSFVDSAHPELGLLFDGRLGEDFKLSTATWVRVGALRLKAIAALAPVALDVVVTGHDRDAVGLLVIPNLDACRRVCGVPSDGGHGVLQHPRLRDAVSSGLRALADSSMGSSMHAARAILLEEPLSIDAGEITDKGYVNQRAVLTRRAALVERLYRNPPDASVIVPRAAERPDAGPRSR